MEKEDSITSKSLEDTAHIAGVFVENLFTTLWKNRGEAMVIQLEGNLGSGKTTFVKAVAKSLGIQGTVTSPTFVLEKIYKIPSENQKKTGFQQLIHIDAYRLGDKDDLNSIGWKEILKDPKNLIFVEWPERIVGAFPDNSTKISFRFVDEETRIITFYS